MSIAALLGTALEQMMINGLNKSKRYAVSICCALPIFFTGLGAHATADIVHVYAGPQSISVNNIIYVTVQTARPQTRIELSYRHA